MKSEIDAFNSSARSVATGGTGATTATEARTNLSAAQSGVNADITSLTALTAVPSVVTTAIQQAIPSGSLIMFGGNTVPAGWLACNGQAISRTTYAALFAAIGTAYGAGDGNSSFNLPNFNGRSPLGDGVSPVSAVSRNRGTSGGAESVVLNTGNMPPHSHGGSTGEKNINHSHSGTTEVSGSHNHTGTTSGAGLHSHAYDQVTPVFMQLTSGGAGIATSNFTEDDATGSAGTHTHSFTANAAGNHSHTFETGFMTGSATTISHTHTIPVQGEGNPVAILNPFLCVKFIIKI